MEGKFSFVILLFRVVTGMVKGVKNSDGSCDVSGANRLECGWLGIDEAICVKRGCCWDSSDRNAKFCFVKKYQVIPEGLCPVAPYKRKECGYFGIKKRECLAKSCCWDESVRDAKWCFKQPKEEPAVLCYIYHGLSGTCKYVCDPHEKKAYGKGECKGRICCYKGN